MNINEVRSHFPQLNVKVHEKPLIYLDNGASTLKCKSVIDNINTHYSSEVSNIHRGVHFFSESGTMKYEQTRKTAQKFINANFEEEIIFTKGTTDSINLVANSFCELFLNEGDEILLSTLEHHSNIVPWQIMAEKKGAKVTEIPILESGDIDLDTYKKLLNPKVKIIGLTFISNGIGTVNPIKKMIELAHSNNSKVLIDAAQAIAHTKVDVQDLDCDFLAFSGHKMYGPTGTGILYGKKDLLNQMPPYQGGGDMIDKVSFEQTTFNDLPHKFEAGTPHIAGFIALNEAFKFIESIGIEQIEAYENELLQYAQSELLKIEGLKLFGNPKHRSGVLSFEIDGAHPQDIGTLLDRQGIAVRTGHHCNQPLMSFYNVSGTTRASITLYNTKEDIDALITGLKKVKEFL